MLVMHVKFFGDPAPRLAIREAHRARLRAEADAGRLVAAGPYGDGSGALMLYRGTRAELDELLASDPYFAAPGVAVGEIQECTLVAGSIDDA